MAKWPIVGYDGNNQLHGVSNRWLMFGGDYQSNATEANTQQEVRDTYTTSNLRLYISTWVGGAGVDDMIATFRNNGAADTQTLTINATGEHEDTTNTDSLVSGDLIDLHCDHSAGRHNDSYTVQTFQVTLDASSDVPPLWAGYQWNSSVVGAAFAPLVGAQAANATETNAEYTMRATRTLRDLRIYCFGHSSGTGVFIIRKNQTDGNLTVSLTGTGEFLDTSNTDSFVAGDEVDLDSDGAGTNIQITARSVEANTSSGIVAGGFNHPGSGAAFATPSSPADSNSATLTEANVQVEAEAAATIQNLFVNCTTYNVTRTFHTRKNAADGNGTVSITGTGIFEDTSNTDTLAAEDDLSFEEDAGSSGQNILTFAVEWETSVGPEVTQPYYHRTGGVPGMRIGRHDGGLGRSW